MVSYRGKRAMDLALALPAFVVSLPVQAVVAVLVRVKLGKPVLFRQVRPGLLGQPFEMVKFRTMLPVDGAKGQTDDASRMTSLGSILRSTSLDELPTLWNVIKGDMSLVGPRPLLMSYLTRYSPRQARRHAVRPGLTGLAQVSGRNGLSWESKFARDIEYVDNLSLTLDLRILAHTLRSVVTREGINASGEATMPEFFGNGPQEPPC